MVLVELSELEAVVDPEELWELDPEVEAVELCELDAVELRELEAVVEPEVDAEVEAVVD